MDELLLSGTLRDISEAFRARRVSVREAAAWCVARVGSIDRSGPSLNAVRELAPAIDREAARLDEELAAGTPRGPLHGIPVLLKDNILTFDMAASGGAAALSTFRPARDAAVAKRLRAAGALIIGKTNLTEFADYVSDVMPSGFSAAGGRVRNPVTGQEYGRGQGSSVGSAASVAASLTPFAIGSETQNSIQTPAVVSSVVCINPSTGLISRTGILPLVPSQDSPGPLARSVDDVILVTAALAGPDAADRGGLEIGPALSRERHDVPARDVRIGVPRRTMTDRSDIADMISAFETVLDELRKAGVTIIDPCDLPAAEQLQDVQSSVFRTEFKAAINAFLQEHGSPCGIDSLQTLIAWNEAHPEAIPYGQSLLLAAQETTGLRDPTYLWDRRRDICLSRDCGIDAAVALGQVDALIAPMSVAAKVTGKAGAPVLAIPAGTAANGNAFGITLYAPRGTDARLLRAGQAVFSIIGKRAAPTL